METWFFLGGREDEAQDEERTGFHVNVFLAYSRRDERRSAAIQARLGYFRRELWRFDFCELVDGRHNFLREATACVVLFSANSRVTEAVRLSHRLRRAPCRRLILIDDHWDMDPQAADVFRISDSERIVFTIDSIVARLIRLFDGNAGGDALARLGEEHGDRSSMPGKLTTFDLIAGSDPTARARQSRLKELFAAAPRPGVAGERFPAADPEANPFGANSGDLPED